MATRLALTLACLCIPNAGAQPSDELSLVQTGMKIRSRFGERAKLLGRMGLLADLATAVRDEAFNCTQYPDFCKAPFNCQDVDSPPRELLDSKGTFQLSTFFFAAMGKRDHASLQTWCGATQYYPYVSTCITQKDLRKAGQIQYQWSVEAGSSVPVAEMDGSYCFMEGHCTNTAVTENTTVEEAEKMCDERYGHAGWAQWTMGSEWPALLAALPFSPLVVDPKTGFHHREITTVVLKAACKMGNYHCDVMYCKETYCQNEYYVKKYKHLEPKTPGHLLRRYKAPRFERPI